MIRFDHITKQYPGTNRPALNDVTLEILRGEFVFLVGASGSGKSSCLRLVLKEEKPTRGSIHVLGQDLGSISSRKVPYFRRNLGVVFQDFRLLTNKSVYDNVAFTLQVIGKSKGFIQEAVPDVLKMVGLAGKASRMPNELSGGEQQRVAIARAVVNKPALLLADEPTGNLDPATSAGIMALLERINAAGTTVLMATHEAGIVDQMQRRVVELVGGQIVRDERHGGYGFTAAIPTQAPARGSGPVDIVEDPDFETVMVKQRAAVVEAEARQTRLAAAEESLAAQEAAAAPSVPPAPQRPAPAPLPTVERPAQRPERPDTAPVEQQRFVPAPPPQPTPPPAPTMPVQRPILPPPAAPLAAPPPPAAPPSTQSIPVVDDEDVPEQLSLAEKLGLRAPGENHDQTGEQNVGPTR
ncbi:cell division ATP-binding protein FtsE [Compostimonas suwonensis]|uniref:Cell division ATP-binding protein FtsE n=1 Tax=Compostimonas suwonensis TaxID=1048394 RepID=A0A2M9BWT3_9MICO|nr:cell division ATP-binding protein FtsE [Compostimonas suwonensis]PJJ62385.1 cell division transport system ATP-binding protein [Compostimonas suwonensis]